MALDAIAATVPAWAYWAIGLLIAFFIVTYLVKKLVPNSSTYYIFSMIRTRKPLPWFDKLAKLGRIWDVFADIAIITGFGAIAVDYLYGRKQKTKIGRIALFVVSFAVLSFIGYSLFGALGSNPLFGDFSIFIGLAVGLAGFCGLGLAVLILSTNYIISGMSAGKSVCPGVAPLIPGVQIPNVPISVPLHGWISLLIILVVHEGLHGIVARREKIRVKSSGIGLLGFLPIAAFVEPDEKQLKKEKEIKQLRVFAVGSMANLATALIVIIASMLAVYFLISPAIMPWLSSVHNDSIEGVVIADVLEEYTFCNQAYPAPAFGVLEKGMLIKAVNGKQIATLYDYLVEASGNGTNQITLTVLTAEGIEEEKTLQPNELGKLGIIAEERQKENYEFPENYKSTLFWIALLSEFFGWLVLLSLLVAIFNFLPLMPFDGGRMAAILFLPYFRWIGMPKKDTEKFITRLFLWIIIILLVINALPLFV